MAESYSSPALPDDQPDTYESEKPDIQPTQPDPSQPTPAPSSSSPSELSELPPTSSAVASVRTVAETPNSNSLLITPPPPLVQSFVPSSIAPGVFPPSAPSFRTVTPVPLPTPQFTPLTNPNFQNHNIQNPNIQPPGVNPVSIMLPGAPGGAGSVTVSVSPLRPAGMYQPPPGQPPTSAMMPMYQQMPNGFMLAPTTNHQGTVPPPGIPRFPSPYQTMVRPAFPLRPPGAGGVLPSLSRPPIPGIHPPIVPPVVRPVLPIVPLTEKPQTTVYVGKIASTVENDFMLSLLRLCGPVKNWKRAQDPSDGTPRGFGFCEFESAEGVLRALRLLSKFNVDGQELVLNVNQATREYLERYVEKKTEREKKPNETGNEEESQPGSEKSEPQSTSEKKDESDSADKENQDSSTFGIVTDEDQEADGDALEKLTSMIEERLKTKPPPPPPAPTTADGSAKSNSEMPSKSRDGDSDVDIMKSAEDKNDDETTSENKPTSENDKPETSSPDRSRRYDRRGRDRDRGRDLKRDKEWELERYERERERERVRRERNREMKIREADRLYKERVKEWEVREREKEYQRQHEKEREKEREREHRREIMDQEDESDDDDTRKRRHRSSVYEEKRKKRQREKEDDLADRLREEEEIADAKRRAIEEQQMRKDEPKVEVANGLDESIVQEESNGEQAYEGDSGHFNHAGDMILGNGIADEATTVPAAVSDMRQSSNAPARKLGFGLVGSGKRTAVPSVFHEEDDDDAEKEKKMRPLVPLDYSTEELKSIHPSVSGAPSSNLAAATEFAKRISNSNTKEERSDSDRDRNRRSTDKSQRDRDRNDEDSNHARDENREKKLVDAKQLIDMIPKTKEELFSFEINWAVYDKHELHERMRPWITKKITEFLGEEEVTLVDYIVSSTKKHVQASQMLELLQSILDDEAEMFVLKMWRMLIFEIKKVETGLSLKPRA
ncbi:RNA-binding protein 25-like isoform X2 [Telopea speciosissima]|uniref:RNA-binding protein 25-like isoform X2 n=1 Tax=Telopea speciosissima TaxID=54955 RepID=UPI001CC665D5|nr:RNA-binding protein 25-like isoform X2 [Telopea speciosissima]